MPEVFAVLEQRVVPRLFDGRRRATRSGSGFRPAPPARKPIRLRCCSRNTSTALDQPSVQLFATDLDEAAIATARDGFYRRHDIVDIPEARLDRFFHREAAGYRVRRELRELILFAHHNIVKDPPFSHLDLISCRNLLIYLNRAAQDRVVETFHFALRPGGYLLLGPSESPDGSERAVRRGRSAHHLYQSRTVASRLVLPELPVRRRCAAAPGRTAPAGALRAARRASPAARGVRAALVWS